MSNSCPRWITAKQVWQEFGIGRWTLHYHRSHPTRATGGQGLRTNGEKPPRYFRPQIKQLADYLSRCADRFTDGARQVWVVDRIAVQLSRANSDTLYQWRDRPNGRKCPWLGKQLAFQEGRDSTGRDSPFYLEKDMLAIGAAKRAGKPSGARPEAGLTDKETGLTDEEAKERFDFPRAFLERQRRPSANKKRNNGRLSFAEEVLGRPVVSWRGPRYKDGAYNAVERVWSEADLALLHQTLTAHDKDLIEARKAARQFRIPYHTIKRWHDEGCRFADTDKLPGDELWVRVGEQVRKVLHVSKAALKEVAERRKAARRQNREAPYAAPDGEEYLPAPALKKMGLTDGAIWTMRKNGKIRIADIPRWTHANADGLVYGYHKGDVTEYLNRTSPRGEETGAEFMEALQATGVACLVAPGAAQETDLAEALPGLEPLPQTSYPVLITNGPERPIPFYLVRRPDQAGPGLPGGGEITLTEADEKILRVLNEAKPRVMHQEDIAAAADVCRKTVGERLEILRGNDLVRRPAGDRGGETITLWGQQALADLKGGGKAG